MKAKVFACSTLADEISKVLPPDIELELMPYALHRTPQKLQSELQERINADTTHDTLLFGYGLCSYGVVNLCSERHTLVIPRIHDCISLLMGAREIYDQEFEKFPASIYLSKGWIDQGAEPLAEFKRYSESYGEETAQWMIDTQYKHYKRVVYINTGVGNYKDLTEYAQRVANYLNVACEERKGSLNLLQRLFSGKWDKEFVVAAPGRLVMQRSFL